jgi:type IV secretion system protein TrbJ
MTSKTKRFLIALGVALTALPAYALFGIPDVVFDPSNYAVLGKILTSDASLLAKTVETYNQTVKIYQTGQSAYMLAQSMAQALTTNRRAIFMTMLQAGVNDFTQDRYGETVNWSAMANGRPELAQQAWTSATIPVTQFPITPTDPRAMSNFQANVATMEILDGSSTKCLQVLGQYRQNLPQTQAAFSALQSAILSADSALNSQIAQLNQMNAGQSQATAEAMAHGALESCLVEQQIVANKVQRDAIAKAMNYQAHTQAVLANNPADWDGASAVGTFHLP